MGLVSYAIAWLAAAIFWSIATASSANMSPLETLPYGLMAMASAGIMGLAVWRLTSHLNWDDRTATFYLSHGLALMVFMTVYSTSWMWPDVLRGYSRRAWVELRSSPVLYWNLLMGSGLYLIIVAISYAIRAQRRIAAHAASAAEARALAQQAQLASLRAQVNPHFLFNALHSVGALVTTDPNRADQALEALGDLLRYALREDDSVLFAQEWRFIKDYLAFEQLRFGERLAIEMSAPAEIMSLPIPPLLLQPLVENAIRHGFAGRDTGGKLVIRARAADGECIIEVLDDGPGSPDGVKDGLGLGTVRKRLAALYGESASLVTAVSGSGFAATIKLPIAREDRVTA